MPINFRSKIDQKLLGYYFANPGAEHYLRELSRIISFNVSFLSRELKILTKNGIFISTKRGREKYFRLNQKHPLYNEIRAIIKSTKP
ncbi:MAG: helix-turn-helix domain-containing protein [bacterium]|nr:helix-turn-helix domain-containing protein [bacterium]